MRSVPHIDQITVDGDDLAEVMVELERSFAIELPQDLRHVETVGDLFDEILRVRQPDGTGDRCDTAMAFYLLRRELGQLGLAPGVRPATPLATQALPSPRKIAGILKKDLGLESPGLVVSRIGCVLAMMAIAFAIGIAVWNWSFAPLSLWLAVIPILALDRGQYDGDWKTMGRLSEALAIRNVHAFVSDGARSDRDIWWRRFAQMLAPISFTRKGVEIESKALGPDTRFDFN